MQEGNSNKLEKGSKNNKWEKDCNKNNWEENNNNLKDKEYWLNRLKLEQLSNANSRKS